MAEPDREVSIHAKTSDDALVNEASRLSNNAEIAQRQMEMTRRLIVAIRAFKTSSDRWQLVLAIITLVLIGVAVVRENKVLVLHRYGQRGDVRIVAKLDLLATILDRPSTNLESTLRGLKNPHLSLFGVLAAS